MKQGNRRAWLLIGAIVGVLALAFAGLAGAKQKTKTFSSGEIDRLIPDVGDGTSLPHHFNIKTKRSKVKDVNVSVRATHSYDGDLRLRLTGPRGQTALLHDINGSESDQNFGSGATNCNGTFTVFNDEAETPISEGTGPYNGQFKPEEPLGVFDNTKLKGKWTFEVEDVLSNDEGILHCVELEIKYKKKKKKRH
jgi:subtilisin-like proprotein convertase family protein